MKVFFRKPCLPVIAATAAVMMAGCPLPFEYNGQNAGNAHTSDPSTPDITASVVVSYSEQGGSSGTVTDGVPFVSSKTTVVTLSTRTANAVIFYTDDGTIPTIATAKRMSSSSGQITLTRTDSVQTLDIYAIAIGPNMLPSQAAHATVRVSPYPILSISCDKPSVTEDGGTATFTITSSSPPAGDVTVRLQTEGDYEAGDVTAGGTTFPASGGFLSVTLTHATTTVSLPITGQPDADSENDTVTLKILPDTPAPPAYTVGLPASATVVVQDNHVPVLILAASASPISDNGGTTVFTVTSSFAPTSALTVNLQTGGTYESTDVSGSQIQSGPGTGFTATIPASETTVSFPVTAHPDAGEFDNETVALSLVANSAYKIGSPGSASVTITDTSPIPVLTMTVDRQSMFDGQSAIFAVTASTAPDANLAVNMVSSGCTVGKVSAIPSSITIPAGQTFATFLVTAPSEVGYAVQNPQVSIVPGTGYRYTIGSPGSQSLLITDDVVGVTYDGVWGFNTDTASGVGGGGSWNLSGNVTLGSGGLSFGGNYDTDMAMVDVPSLDHNDFTLALKFTMPDLDLVYSRPIIVGGAGCRWIVAQVDEAGSLSVDFNNHGYFSGINDPAYRIDLGMAIAPNVTYTLVLNVDIAGRTLTVWLNGAKVIRPLPSDFVWEVPEASLSCSPTTSREARPSRALGTGSSR